MGQSRTRSFLAVLLIATTTTAFAQNSGGSSGGTHSLSERVDLSYQQRYVETPADGRTDWMQFIVLWRGEPGWHMGRGVTPQARTKTWTSGDTTFMARPSKNGLDVFLDNLKKDPAIAAFIQ